jgi:phage tail P2-like protein
MDRKFSHKLIPPGINDQRTRSLLDAFCFAASQLDFSSLLMRNASEIPDDMLELALHDFSLAEFVSPSGLPVEAARRLIDQSWPLHEKKGTDDGMRLGLSLLGTRLEIKHWWQEQPPAAHDTQKVTVWFSDQLFEDSTIADGEHQSVAWQIVAATKRWSQDTVVSFGVVSLVDLFVGAFAVGAGAFVAALPDDDPVASPVPVQAGVLALASGVYHSFVEVA